MEGSHGPNDEHYSYVEDESQFSSELICTVCHDVAGMHAACPGCSQTFCQNCVHKWFNTQKSNASACTCPYCRRKLKFSDLKHDAAIQEKLDQLQVYCPNKQVGCTAIIARGSLPAHLNRSCWAQHCSCKYCGKSGLRKDIREHESSRCPERLVPCSNAAAGCTALAPFSRMQWHLDYVCGLQPRPCPHCNQQVPRFRWANHLERDCTAQQFCPLRLYGCSYSGTAQQVEQHGEHCSYAQRRQQLEQQLLAGGSPATSSSAAAAELQANLAEIDMAELPASCVIDSHQAFGASSVTRSAARASQLIMQAMPECMLPPKLQQDSNWMLARVTAAEQAESPATLASLTPPKQIITAAAAAGPTQRTAGTAGMVNSVSSSSSSLSAAEALALGTPQCLTALGLGSEPWVESAWRIMQNLAMVDVFANDMSDLPQLPGSFLLYTAICRAWDTVVRVLAPQQEQLQQPERSQSRGSNDFGITAGAEMPSASTGSDRIPAVAAGREAGGSRATTSSSSGSSNSSDDSQEDLAIPGLERGLYEGEYEDLEGWVWHQRDMLAAVATVTYHVLLLWTGVGPVMGVPQLDAQIRELQRAGVAAFCIVGELASTKWASKRSSSGGGRQDAPADQPQPSVAQQQQGAQQQQQSAEHHGSGGIAAASTEVPSWSSFALRAMLRRLGGSHAPGASQANGTSGSSNSHSRHAQQQQQGSTAAAAAAAAAPTRSRSSAAGASASSAAAAAGQRPDKGLAPDAAGNTPHQFADYTAALQHLRQLGSGPPLAKKSRIPELLHGRTSAEAIELATAVLILHHARQQHIEISMIPQTTPLLQHGFRAYWAPGILAGGRAWLGPRFRLGWQAVAVLNDMVMGLAGRLLDVMNEGFFDPETSRVPMSPRLALAAVQLVMPQGLLAGYLPRVAALSRAYHDEECEELSEVTWNALQQRLGLKLELDKLVTLVDQHLPVQYYADEDEDEDEDSYTGDEDEEETAASTDADQSDSEYTTDDEYMQEEAQEQEQQQPLQQQQQPSSPSTRCAALYEYANQLRCDPAWRATYELPSSSSTATDRGSGARGPNSFDIWRQTAESQSSWESDGDPEPTERDGQPAASTAVAAPVVAHGTADQTEGAAGRDAGNGHGVEAYKRTMEGYLQQQQQQQAGPSSSTAAAAAAPTGDVIMSETVPQQFNSRAVAGVGGSDLHAEFLANLNKLSSESPDLSHYELHLLRGPQHEPDEPPVQGSAGSKGSTPQQQQQQQQRDVAGLPSSAQQQQRQQQEDKDSGDTTTHGVVIIAGFLEAVLQQLLEAAAQAAEQEAAVAAIAAGGGASASADGDVSMQIGDETTAAGQQAASSAADGAGVSPTQQQQQQATVCITARHVLLAAAGNPELKAMLLDRPGAQNQSNPAAVAWAGVVPGFDSRLLPQPSSEPITAWLYSVAAGKWQHPHGAGMSSTCSSGLSTCRILFPADLRHYCGRTWSTGAGMETAAVTAAAAAGMHDRAATAPGSTDRGVTCCFLSGWQCGECAAATAVLADADLDARLEACEAGLAGLAVSPVGESGMDGPSAAAAATKLESGLLGLGNEQLQQLVDATRMYHLQQQWWYGSVQDSVSSNSGSTSSLPPAWQSLPIVDQAQLVNVARQLQPLRDVVALREMLLQQMQDGLAWPAGHFAGMVHHACDAVAAEKRQQKALQLQMQQLIAPSASISAAAAAAGAGNSADEDSVGEDILSDDDMEIDAEAMHVLATAAEDFLVQQFRSANELALHAGTQELQPQHLRMALMSNGYRHVLQQLRNRHGPDQSDRQH